MRRVSGITEAFFGNRHSGILPVSPFGKVVSRARVVNALSTEEEATRIGSQIQETQAEINEHVANLVSVFHHHPTLSSKEILQKLREYGDRAVPGIVQVLLRYDENSKLSAVETVARLGPKAKDTIPALLEVLSIAVEYAYLRERVIHALGCMGSEGEPAVDTLVRICLSGKEESVRTMAAWALGNIGVTDPGELHYLVSCFETYPRLRDIYFSTLQSNILSLLRKSNS